MPKPKSPKTISSTQKPSQLWPFYMAIILMILGAIGLKLTRVPANNNQLPAADNQPFLSVRESQDDDSPQSPNQGGQSLQPAAKVNDLINNKGADQLQPGSAVESLLKNHSLR